MRSSEIKRGGEQYADDKDDPNECQSHLVVDETALQAARAGTQRDGAVHQFKNPGVDGVAVGAAGRVADGQVDPAGRKDGGEEPLA